MKPELLRSLAENEELLEVGREAVENALLGLRDSRLSILDRGNGLCIREKDGTPSSLIRLGTESALSIALKAIADKLEKEDK